MKSKLKNIALTAIFCGGLAAVFGLNLLTPDRLFSEQENRVLTSMPVFSFADLKNGTYTAGTEAYITDQFVGRDTWTGIKWMADMAIGKRESNGIYIGKNQTLIPALTDFDESRKERHVQAISKLAENAGATTYFALIPSAAEIWRERLPFGAPGIEQKSLIDSVYAQMPEEVTCIDIYGALLAKKAEPLFYRTDHHWTTLGAYYGYEQVMSAMQKLPAMASPTFQTVSENFLGTSQSKSGVRFVEPDTIQIYTPAKGNVEVDSDGNGLKAGEIYHFDALLHKDQYKVFFDGNQPLMRISNEETRSGQKLLVVKDSYANSMLPFMTEDFQEIHVLDMRFVKKSVSEYAAENGIDQILVMYGLSGFLTDPNIAILQ